MKRLSEKERRALANALRVAGRVWGADAVWCSKLPRLAKQFEAQRKEALAMADRLEQAELIELKEKGPE